MCINCEHNARFLTSWKTFIVQCSYANPAVLLLARVGSCSLRAGTSADSLNQRSAYSPIRSNTDSLIRTLTHSPIRAITYSPIHLFT